MVCWSQVIIPVMQKPGPGKSKIEISCKAQTHYQFQGHVKNRLSINSVWSWWWFYGVTVAGVLSCHYSGPSDLYGATRTSHQRTLTPRVRSSSPTSCVMWCPCSKSLSQVAVSVLQLNGNLQSVTLLSCFNVYVPTACLCVTQLWLLFMMQIKHILE